MELNKLNEYYLGNPDHITDVDEDSHTPRKLWCYDTANMISFGYFQDELGGDHVLYCRRNMSHGAICKKIAEKMLGKALYSDKLQRNDANSLMFGIYNDGCFLGRVFLEPKVVTTWSVISPARLRDILKTIGDIGPLEEYEYVSSCYKAPNGEYHINLLEYLDTVSVEDDEYELEKMRNNKVEENNPRVDPRIIKLIKSLNGSESNTLDDKLAKAKMTRAEYNWWKTRGLGDSVEPRKVMKENNRKNMKNKKINEEFSNYMSIMTEALGNGDYKAYEYVRDILDEAVEDKKRDMALADQMKTNNFGVLNHIFENELPSLIKSNKKAVKEVIKTIKEDKNLLGQFNFYNVIKEQYKGDVTKKFSEMTMLEKLSTIVTEDIDLATVKASNKKLRKVMVENNVTPSEFIDEEDRRLYENGHIILTRKKTTANMIPLMESYDALCKYLQAHKDDEVKKRVDINEMVKEFEEKLKTNLNESEMSFVKQITDFKSPMAEQRKEKLFNKFKAECIEKVNKMLSEDSSNLELSALKEQLESQKYNKETIVKDIAKLLEIRDILMEE